MGSNLKDYSSAAIPSLKKRYIVKLVANLAAPAIGIGVQYFATRSLGLENYGIFIFLTALFAGFFAFFDNGLGAFVSTKLAQEHSSSQWRFFIMLAAIGVAALIFLVVIASAYTGFLNKLWLEIDPKIVWYGFSFGLLTWWYGLAVRAADAIGLTLISETIRIIQKFGLFSSVLLLWAFNSLSISSFLLTQIAVIGISLLYLVINFKKTASNDIDPSRSRASSLKTCWMQYWHYSAPLILSSAICLVADTGDRWLLQRFGGAGEQGFYGLSTQIGSLCLVFASAMMPLLAREVALAHSQNNDSAIGKLFSNFGMPLYALAAMISCFVVLHSEWLAVLIGGAQFKGAALPISLMAFYPVHQTIGQIVTTIALATAQTKVFGRFAVAINLVGPVLTFILLSPDVGLQLGATGLAAKMVGLQFISVNVLIFLVLKKFGLSLKHLLWQQCTILCAFLILASLARFAGAFEVGIGGNNLLALICAGVAYLILCLSCCYFMPRLLGLTMEQRNQLISMVRAFGLRARP